MWLTSDSIRTVSALLAIGTVLGGIVWFAASMNARVSRLEEEVHTLAVAPTITNAVTGDATANPIAQACADLARKAADEAGLMGSVSAQVKSEEMLRQLGCVRGR